MSDSFSTPNSFNFQNTPIPNLTTQMKTEDHPTGSIPHFSMTGHIAAPHNSGFVNSILHPTALSSPLLSNSKTTHAVPLFRSNSIDSDKFLPASCLNQLVKDFYKSSSEPGTTRPRKRERKIKKEETPSIKTEAVEETDPIPPTSSTVRISREARELLPLLANEFIHYITTNATKICEESDKKTINHEHIVASLKRTNFTEFMPECNEVAKDASQQAAKRRKNSHRLENSNKSLAELETEQAAMFEAARLAMMAEYEQNVVDAENAVQVGNADDASCSVQLPDELADNDDYD